MSNNQNIESSVEIVLFEFKSWYDSILLDLIVDRPIAAPLNDEVMFGLLKNLKKHEQLSAVTNIKSAKLDLDNSVQGISDFEGESNKKELVQIFMDSYGRLAYQLQSCLNNNKSNSSLDIETGLKKPNELPLSYKVEMERLDRHSEPFTLCLLRCDPIWHKETKDIVKFLKVTADIVLGNLRVFDDAYRWKDEYIIVLLKHTRSTGGVIFYERVQRQFDTVKEVDGHKITISSCIVSPVEGKKMEELLSEMKEDLDVTCKDVKDDYITMTEATDLQKFLGKES